MPRPKTQIRLRIKQDAADFLPPQLLKFRDQANWLQHVIIYRVAQEQTCQWGQEDREGFVPLKWAYMENQLGKSAMKQLIPWLLENDFLVKTPNYKQGVESTGYLHGAKIAHLKPYNYVMNDPRLIARIKNMERVESKKWNRVYRHLRAWAKAVTVEFTLAEYMSSLKRVSEAIKQKKDNAGCTPEEIGKKAEDCYELLEIIRSVHRQFKVCDYGRFHSPITQLKRELRSLLKLEGDRLANVDISNSQPLILGMTFLSEEGMKIVRRMARVVTGWSVSGVWVRSGESGPVVGEDGDGIPFDLIPEWFPSAWEEEVRLFGSPESQEKFPDHQPLSIRLKTVTEKGSKPLKNKRLNPQEFLPETPPHAVPPEEVDSPKEETPLVHLAHDVELYLRLCETGKLYEFLMEGMGWIGDRDAWKDEVWFLFLYGMHRSAHSILGKPVKDAVKQQQLEATIPLREFFAKTFPTLEKWMKPRKRPHTYRDFPCSMQRRESDIMMLGVCGTLMVEHPEIPVLTIHDSVMTPPRHVPVIKQVIAAEFAKFGIVPNMKVDDYSKYLVPN